MPDTPAADIPPPLTVLMCVYDGEAYLREAIDSILGQSFRDFELLVVDDASRDATPEILASYRDPRLRVVRNEVNRKHTASLNIGLRHVRGALIAQHDADDRSHPSRLERQVRFMEANPHVALLGTGHRNIDRHGRLLRGVGAPRSAAAAAIRWQLLFGNPFSHSSVMFRRSIVVDELGGYDEHFLNIEDLELWSRIGRRYAMTNLLEPLVDLRSHSESITAHPSVAKCELVRTVLRSNLIATLGEGDYEAWLDFWMTANNPVTYGRIANIERATTDLPRLRARFMERYPEAEGEPEVDRMTAALLAGVSSTVAGIDRAAAFATYRAAVRADAATALRLMPRIAAKAVFGAIRRRRLRP